MDEDNFDRIKKENADYTWTSGRSLDWFAWLVLVICGVYVVGFWLGWWGF